MQIAGDVNAWEDTFPLEKFDKRREGNQRAT